MSKRALISVTDKSGVVEFARELNNLGYEVISTGNTFKILKENGVNAITIDEVTKFPEMLDGRVKTLNPYIHGGILYKRDEKNHKELMPVLQPVIEKVSSIISQHIADYDVQELSLVGGTCCLTGIESIIEKRTGVFTHKPKNPMFVTPLGIALSCGQEEMQEG